MHRLLLYVLFFLITTPTTAQSSGIRYNQLGYLPAGIKIAVYGSKVPDMQKGFRLIDAHTRKPVFQANTSKAFGGYGPFQQTYRLDFTSFQKPGKYFLECGGAKTDTVTIGNDVYKGKADFCLRYMRQQRSGFNPFLKDSCHTHDGYTLYGAQAGLPDSTHIDVVGGWHDASDYLQYSTTSANATYHLLMAARDFPTVFTDTKKANGLDGKNGLPDVLDEAKWGLDWLQKMHPKSDWIFNQLGDDRDHQGMRIPQEDSFYGKGFERPVYFCNGEPQQRGKFLNASTGVASTAGKFTSAFALGGQLFAPIDKTYSSLLIQKSYSALQLAKARPGVAQTASVRSPYIYAEDNYFDDMELANAALANIEQDGVTARFYENQGQSYAKREPVTPWLGSDTAKHYQWYPFINLGHYELAKRSKMKPEDNPYLDFYEQGIEKVWAKAQGNAFYRGVPFIWCSNNLTVAFAMQCYWFRILSKNNRYAQLEQANFDWLFGCNPWGTSMVYGLPAHGDSPVDPHSAFTHLKNYPIDGGLVDGPVYTSIYRSLIGITLKDADEYADWQSDLAVYHDDYGDYSTNEPTMDGTASLVYLLAAKENDAHEKMLPPVVTKNKPAIIPQEKSKPLPPAKKERTVVKKQPAKTAAPIAARDFALGAVTRGDTNTRRIALVFTGHEFGDGGKSIAIALKQEKVKASFFFTGDFYRNRAFTKTIQTLKAAGHYLGPHSDKHLLYAPWEKRDSLLVTQDEFNADLDANYAAMKAFGLTKRSSPYFLPPYEWFNDSIAAWTKEYGLQLVNFTPGTMGNADYTTPEMPNYRTSDTIYQSIINKAIDAPVAMNGYILLLHIGTDPARTDKFYMLLPLLLQELTGMGYTFVRIDQLLGR